MANDIELRRRLSSLNLAPTFVNILEICTQERWINKIDDLRKLLEGILPFYHNLRAYAPFIHIAQLNGLYLDHPREGVIDWPFEVLKEGYDHELWLELNTVYYGGIRSADIEGAKMMNDWLDNVRRYPEDAFSRSEYSNIARQCIKNGMSTISVDLSCGKGLDWSLIEFHLEVHASYLRILKMNRSAKPPKFKVNDWADLFNLSYVQPGMKYLTFEKQTRGWRQSVQGNSVLENYFMNHSALI